MAYTNVIDVRDIRIEFLEGTYEFLLDVLYEVEGVVFKQFVKLGDECKVNRDGLPAELLPLCDILDAEFHDQIMDQVVAWDKAFEICTILQA